MNIIKIDGRNVSRYPVGRHVSFISGPRCGSEIVEGLIIGRNAHELIVETPDGIAHHVHEVAGNRAVNAWSSGLRSMRIATW